ncbi:MAG: tetratricopeptide repeat protein, partial [Anaerolineae bacterium]|nr:tetratricopeptide repeat protein [Anaerolineae bacterium]
VGRVLASFNEWELAAEAFHQSILSRPDYGEAWAYLSEARQHIGQDGSADLERALALAPDSLAVMTLASLYWQRQGDYDQAIAYLNAAVAVDPGNPVLQVELGRTFAEKGDLAAAQGYYQKAIELDPHESAYWRSLAEFALSKQIQIRELALPAARQAVLLAPADPAALDVMGQALLMLDDSLTAERFLRRALQADPKYAAAHLHLGQVYLLQGDRLHARQELDQAIALAPGSTTAAIADRLLQRYFP